MVKMTAAHKLSVVHLLVLIRFPVPVDTFPVVDLLVLIRFPLSSWHVVLINEETSWLEILYCLQSGAVWVFVISDVLLFIHCQYNVKLNGIL